MKLKSYASLFFSSIFFILVMAPTSCYAQSPQLEWAIGVGGTGSDFGNAIAIDNQGNTYTTGFFTGTVDFDPGSGIQNLSSLGACDIFILKTDAAGNYVWAKSIGGSSNDAGNAIAISPSGYIYITGFFCHTVDFDPGPGIDTITNADDPCNTEIYILKLDTAGNFVWAKTVEGVVTYCTAATDVAYGIDLDESENVYITGYFQGHADFNTSQVLADTFFLTTTSNLTGDIFILKLDAAGNFKWVKRIGNALSDTGYGLHVSDLGFVYITGLYGYDEDFDPGPGTDTLVSYGNWDLFILKLDTAGNHIWAKGIGGASDDRGFAVTTDSYDNLYTTGHFTGTVDFNPSTAVNNLVAPSGGRGIFLLKLDPAGNYIWAKAIVGTLSGGGEREGTALAVDAANNIYTTGHFTETVDFNPSPLPADTFFLTAIGAWNNTDAFILKMDSSGNFIWAVSMGVAGVDRGTSLAVDASYNVYSSGYYAGTVDFDPQAGTQNLIGAGSNDIYIQKLNQSTTSVAEQNNSHSVLSVFPNPTENILFLQSKNLDENNAIVSVMDISGRILFQKNFETSNEELNTWIDLHEFSSGIYFVQVKMGEKIYSAKVMRE